MSDPVPIRLTVTPGVVWTDTTPVDAARLNQTANPQVEIPPDAQIPASFLDLDDLVMQVGETFRGKNFLRRSNFWPNEWLTPAGLICPVLVQTENALDWWAEPAGAGITVARIQDAPNNDSDFAAQLVGATGVTSVEYGTWVPASIAGSLRGQTLTFSAYVKNLTGAIGHVTVALCTAETLDAMGTAVEVVASPAAPVVNGDWTRVQFTWAASDYPNFRNGVYILLRTANLTTNVKTMHVAQAQLEVAPTASAFIKPQLPPIPKDSNVIFPDMATKTTSAPFDIVSQDRMTGEKVYLADPPAILATPVVGFDRQTGRPKWIDITGNKLVLSFTGVDQIITVPAGATSMLVHAWGGGGGNDDPSDTGLVKGGVGGYCKCTFPVVPGTQYSVVVGEGHNGLARRAYGFGGAGQGQAHNHVGGGLSGIFTGTTTVGAGDFARALVIAGGGGAGGQSGGGRNAVQGGNGNESAYSGTTADFQGVDATGGVDFGNGGGGGGRFGGGALSLGGKGGTGFCHTSGTSNGGTPLHAFGTANTIASATRPSLVVPGSTAPEYVAGTGQSGKPGLVVIIYT